MNTVNIATILTLLKTQVEAITLPASFDASEPVAFSKVVIFDMRDLAKAMDEAYAYGNRICIILASGGSASGEVAGREVRLTPVFRVSLLFSDRRYENRILALTGDATTAGAGLLLKVLTDELSGELSNGCVVIPTSWEPFALEREDRSTHNGRIVFTLDLEIYTGMHIAPALSRLARKAGTP